jgi:autotransporter-associated beta strand protein/parallel beta-helix repeat protein
VFAAASQRIRRILVNDSWRRANQSRFFRPHLEHLEERLTPNGHVWTGAGGNTNWSNPNNWSDGAPSNSESGDIILQFPATAMNFATTDDLSGLRVYQVQFLSNGYIIQAPFNSTTDLFMQASSQQLPPGIIDDVGGNSIRSTVNLKVVDPSEVPLVIEVDSGILDCSAYTDLNGSGRLLKQGAGALQIGGINLSLIDVQSGALIVGSPVNFIIGSPTLALENGSTIDAAQNGINVTMPVTLQGNVTVGGSNSLSFEKPISGSGSLIQTNTASVRLDASDAYSGGTTIAAGGMVLGQAAALPANTSCTVAGGASLNMDDLSIHIGSLSGSGAIFLGSGSLTTGADNSSTTWTGFIGPLPATPADNFGSLIKQGTGTFTMNGTTNYRGATDIQGGALAVGNLFAVGVGYIGGVPSFDGITFEDGTTLTATGGTLALLNPIDLEGAVTIGGSLGLNLLGGVFGPGSLTQTDPATLLLAGASCSGATIVTSGTLILGSAQLPGRLTVESGGTLSLGGPSVSIGSLAGDGTVLLNGYVLSTGGDNSDSEWSGTIGPFADPSANPDPGGLLKQGFGTFTLEGTRWYTGVTEVQTGTLAVGPGDQPPVPGKLVLDDGSTLTAADNIVDVPNPVVLNGAVTFGGTKTMELTYGVSGPGSFIQTDTLYVDVWSASYAGNTTVNAGHLFLADVDYLPGRVTINSSASLDMWGSSLAIGSLAGSGTVNLFLHTLTAGSDNSSTTWSGSIGPAGDGGGLTKVGSGAMILSGTNTYLGPTMIEAGVLEVASETGLSNMTRAVVAAFASLQIDKDLAIGSLEGPVYSYVVFFGSTSLGGNGLSTNFAGQIVGPGNLIKEGTGIFTDSGYGNYTGYTDVKGGTLREGKDDAFASTFLFLGQGTTFDLNNFQQQFHLINGAGTVDLGIGSLFLGSDNPVFLDVTNVTITGPGRVIKTGRSFESLLGNNTYSGLTADTLGTLEIDGAQPSSPVNVGIVAQLGGSGTVGSIVVSGNVSPGSAFSSPGKLSSSGDVTFLAGSSLAIRLNGTATGTYDQLAATGRIDLSGSPALNLSVGFTAASGNAFTILTAAGGIVGTFAGLPEGATLTLSSITFQIHYLATSVVLVVPGPFVVTTTADRGPGSLRQAILDADVNPVGNTIDFNITGSGVQTITPLTPLPAVTEPVTIDGYSQPGASVNTLTHGDNAVLLIELDGSAAPLGSNGLTISAGNSTIRGLVINNFSGDGIALLTNGGDQVEGNFIGTNAAGAAALANGGKGVTINDSAGNTIGGTTADARNVISHNSSYGVAISGSGAAGNVVEGNYIGLQADGASPLGNLGGGVLVDGGAASNTIGGTAAGAGNVLGGVVDGDFGIALDGVGTQFNVIAGNFIGTDSTGSHSGASFSYDIVTGGSAQHNTIGGTDAGARNLIDGAAGDAAIIGNFTDFRGNYVGLDVTGTQAISNINGIDVEGFDDTIAGNVISGNKYGIALDGCAYAVVQGNLIGTTATGTAALANGLGIEVIAGARNNTIGGTTAAAGNVISGNSGDGVQINGSGVSYILTSGNLVEGDLIGTDATGTVALPNGGDGVLIRGGAVNNTIGGTTSGAGNVIAYNSGQGVQIAASPTDSATIDNGVRGNSIYRNTGLGIDLGGDGVTPNHTGNVPGPNDFQNYPVLAESGNSSNTVITGSLIGLPNTTYIIDFFTNQSPDTTGYGQGQVCLGSTLVSTDSAGYVPFTVTFNSPFSQTHFLTATATDPAGNTSEFSHVADLPLNAIGSTVGAFEGTSFTQAIASFTDTDPNGKLGDYSATLDWGDGSVPTTGTVTQSGTAFNVIGSHTYAEEGNYAITVTIVDQGSSQATAKSTANVAIVTPTASLSGPANGVPGQPRTFTFKATDVSPVDQAAGFTYAINWGDGSPVLTISRTAGNGTGVAFDHVYTKAGSYSVTMTATEDGGSTGSANQSVNVQSVQMQGNSLVVGGTLGNDTITLSPADTVGDINVNLNSVSQGSFKPTDHIFVYGQSGNDTIQLATSKFKGITYYITVPAFIYGGGTSNETLSVAGSTANNVVIGGGGTNQITGGLGRDMLIAGLGSSKLYAGSGDSILIGGTTDYDLTSTAMTYDLKIQALEAIMSEWGRTDADYATRVAHLSGTISGGLNGSAFLNISTVHSNHVADTLFGAPSPALDWFFADISDLVKNSHTGEVTTGIT